ncbi:hypothetical protein ACJIZ3_022251 [Penstemon smallii]|uniref:Polygalacturonase n=1 Tax=Penstemon smallii TaxID=265156 RepID=A0ABD3TLQ7_9LAMI
MKYVFMDGVFLWFSLAFFLCNRHVQSQPNYVFKVTEFGAIPDGKTDSSNAFASVWKKACETQGGLVVVPFGTYFVSSATFQGPCNGKTLLQIDGNIIASSDPSLNKENWIQFYSLDGLDVSGRGTFDGRGASAWPYNNCDVSSNCNLPPVSIDITSVKNASFRGINSINSKGFHFNIVGSDNVVIKNVHITAPKDSPNTDGIHIGKSNNIKIFNTHISTGDDCVSLGDGNTNINITRVWCGPGHGISIGSLGKYKGEEDVRGITVRNCSFDNTENGLRIKTWAPSTVSTTVSDVTFEEIIANNVENPVIIDQYYCPHSACSHSGESTIGINGVKFINVKGTSATQVSVNIRCSKAKHCTNIELSGFDLKLQGTGEPTTALCSNADAKIFGSNQLPLHCS